jgi:hypothetical protein
MRFATFLTLLLLFGISPTIVSRRSISVLFKMTIGLVVVILVNTPSARESDSLQTRSLDRINKLREIPFSTLSEMLNFDNSTSSMMITLYLLYERYN